MAHVMADRSSGAARSADQAAEVVLGVLQSGSPALRGQTSRRAAPFVGTRLSDLDGSAVLGETSSWVR